MRPPAKRTVALAALLGLLAVLVVILPRPAGAGGGAFCSAPFVFPGSDVNVVVLPYGMEAPDAAYRQQISLGQIMESRIAGKLSILIQLDTLFALSYPAGMAAVHLIPDGPRCTEERILPVIQSQIQDGKGLVLVWGQFLERGDELYVQSYVRFLRQGRTEELAVPLDDAGDVRLAGAPAQQAVGFAPRLLTADDIAALDAAFERATRIYAEPGSDAVTGRLALEPERPFAYYVDAIDHESGRMHVRPHDFLGGPEGWIEARADPAVWPLRQKLPELAFVNAVAGYLAARIIAEEQLEDHWAGDWPSRLGQAVRTSQTRFDDYLGAVGADSETREAFDERAAAALALDLEGMLDLLAAPVDVDFDHVGRAASRFVSSGRLLPYQAETWNLRAMALAGMAERDETAPAQAVHAWSNAISLEPGNDRIAANLAAYYRHLLDTGTMPNGLTAAELRARIGGLDVR